DVLLYRYHFDKGHLIELYDEQATRRNILNRLRYLAQNVDHHDALVIFYAGHGHLDPITKEGSWIPVESATKDVSAWISNHAIKNDLKVGAIKAKHILLISDSCCSRDFVRGQRGKLPQVTDKVIKRAYKLTSRQAISSGGLEPVSDAGFGGNSVFSHFLVKTLKENQKPFLVPSDLFPDIKAGVAENAEQFPRFGSLKDTGGQQGGELVLFLKQDSRLKALSTQTSEKKAEFERLKQMEADADNARKKETEEISRRERELAELDAKIVAMKKRLGGPAVKADDSLDAMLAMVKRKEEQERRLYAVKRKREKEEANREQKLARVETEKRAAAVATLEEDIRKYQDIVSSSISKGIELKAWRSLIAKYPKAAKDLKPGDTTRLLYRVKWSEESILAFSIGIELVFIPAGTFTMENHRVTLNKNFYIGSTEVTQGQWRKVMGNNPSYFDTCGDDCPVEGVSWNEVQEFIDTLNHMESTDKYRLPTEAEWEYACRAGSNTKFCFGDDESSLGEYAWYRNNSRQQTHPVGRKRPNAWGLHDMHGNVWEWCQDWYSKQTIGKSRMNRGGSWHNSAAYCKSEFRYRYGPDAKQPHVGFRLLKEP
ncbi:MAG: SUMF1/EgtB/PvdO family nonheme iron enzyme, partial [Deltaproteobacteria bacterium]|nr:SUMF1/EgtB/PvdO family nonheme iron enzyme [Deltaproteobacteria bacterium]